MVRTLRWGQLERNEVLMNSSAVLGGGREGGKEGVGKGRKVGEGGRGRGGEEKGGREGGERKGGKEGRERERRGEWRKQ